MVAKAIEKDENPPGLRQELACRAFQHTAATLRHHREHSEQALRSHRLPRAPRLRLRPHRDAALRRDAHQRAAFYRKAGPATSRSPESWGPPLHGKQLSFTTTSSTPTSPLECVRSSPSGPPGHNEARHAVRHRGRRLRTPGLPGRPGPTPTRPSAASSRSTAASTWPRRRRSGTSSWRSSWHPASTRTPWALERKKNLRSWRFPGLTGPTALGDADPQRHRRAAGAGPRPQPYEPASEGRDPAASKGGADGSLLFAARCVSTSAARRRLRAGHAAPWASAAARPPASTPTFIATHKGGDRIKGSVMASDAFLALPRHRGLAAKHGVAAIVQPGAPSRDDEVIAPPTSTASHGLLGPAQAPALTRPKRVPPLRFGTAFRECQRWGPSGPPRTSPEGGAVQTPVRRTGRGPLGGRGAARNGPPHRGGSFPRFARGARSRSRAPPYRP